jgi:hypothetical protein
MPVSKPAGICPVGSIIAFLTSYTNVPALPSEWVAAGGQTLSDAQSVFNGQVIPNLNGASSGTQRFLRGCTTSGGTGGTDTSSGIGSHNHAIAVAFTCNGQMTNSIGIMSCAVIPNCTSNTCITTCSIGTCTTGAAFSILPSYYQVSWIMRIK